MSNVPNHQPALSRNKPIDPVYPNELVRGPRTPEDAIADWQVGGHTIPAGIDIPAANILRSDTLAVALNKLNGAFGSASFVINMLTTTVGTFQTIATVNVPNDSALGIVFSASGVRTDAFDVGYFNRRALVYRTGGGPAVILGPVDSDLTRRSDAAWDTNIIVSGNDALLQVRGAAGSTINWLSRHIEDGVV